MNARFTRVSKYLALRLRHDPGGIGLELDAAGWASVDDLLRLANADGFEIARTELEDVVATNDKQRYEFDDQAARVRARQGHSVSVDLGLPPVPPPTVLYHGTIARALGRIRADGLRPMARQHVHLSPDRETATVVGARRGRPVVLTVRARRMAADGYVFYRATNGVWLTAEVPPSYLGEDDEGTTAGTPRRGCVSSEPVPAPDAGVRSPVTLRFVDRIDRSEPASGADGVAR